MAEVKEWVDATKNNSVMEQDSNASLTYQIHQQSSWIRPQDGLVKCNVDASCNYSTRNIAGGWIVCGHLEIDKLWGSAQRACTLLS